MWDTKYRPLKFADVLGQEGNVTLLKLRLAQGTALNTSYIFAGGHGQGKTTLARILARAVLCLNLDKADPEPCNTCENCVDMLGDTSMAFVEQDSALGGTTDNIRAIIADLPFAVYNAAKRIYLFDEAHRMSTAAQDVLLKPLEERKMLGIFCTTEVEKIRGAIRSRCQEYAIRKVTREDVLGRMQMILNTEGVEHEDEAVLTVIDASHGHVRDVIRTLEMIALRGPITMESVRGCLRLSVVVLYYQVLLSLADAGRAVALIEQACEEVSPEEVSAGLAEASMNSFRLAHGMFADSTLVDRKLAQQVYAAFGDQTIKLAEYFLRSKHTSKTGLFCDVVSLQGGVPTSSVAANQVPFQVQPVVRQVLAPVPEPVQEPEADVGAGAIEESEVEATPTEPVVPPVAAPVVVPATPAKPVDTRADGVGNLGSSDIAALTECDQQGTPKDRPRGRNVKPQAPTFTNSRSAALGEVLSPEQWRREYQQLWSNMLRGLRG